MAVLVMWSSKSPIVGTSIPTPAVCWASLSKAKHRGVSVSPPAIFVAGLQWCYSLPAGDMCFCLHAFYISEQTWKKSHIMQILFAWNLHSIWQVQDTCGHVQHSNPHIWGCNIAHQQLSCTAFNSISIPIELGYSMLSLLSHIIDW